MMTTSYWSAVGTTSSMCASSLRPAVLLHGHFPRPVAGLHHQVIVAGPVDEDLIHRTATAAIAVGVAGRGVEPELGVHEENAERVGVIAVDEPGVDALDV